MSHQKLVSMTFSLDHTVTIHNQEMHHLKNVVNIQSKAKLRRGNR
jgi:16S rRNA U1498 N3-methylase RsmE